MFTVKGAMVHCRILHWLGKKAAVAQWPSGGTENCFWRKHGQLQAPNKIKFHMEVDQTYPKAPNKIKKILIHYVNCN